MTVDREKLNREEEANQEMLRTSIHPVAACLLTATFLAIIFAVPVIQQIDNLARFSRHQTTSPTPALDVLRQIVQPARIAITASDKSLTGRVFEANRLLLSELKRLETILDQDFCLTRFMLPRGQYLMTHLLGAGNEQVYTGRGKWLFYRYDIDHASGPAFLGKHQPHNPTDPIAAIVDFNRQLKNYGITLILMPVPAKPTIQPDKFYRQFDTTRNSDNPSYAEFVNQLQKMDIRVFDCNRMLKEQYATHEHDLYLRQDTHWRPETVELVAAHLADMIKGLLPERPAVAHKQVTVHVAGAGDLLRLLHLPDEQQLYPLERVQIKQVLTADGELWTKTPDADVLVLGDSFSNIYSTPSLGWGSSAGLVEQLSFNLQRPVDRITINDKGAFATRQELARSISIGMNPLNGKKVLIWQFAARELTSGNWQIIPLARQ